MHVPASSILAESNLEVNKFKAMEINPISEVNIVYSSCFEPEFDRLGPQNFDHVKQAVPPTNVHTDDLSKLKKRKNRKIKKLREEIQKKKLLDRHIKSENELLKTRSVQLNDKHERLITKYKNLFKKVEQWYTQVILLSRYNIRLKIKLLQ
jgi:Skp family chaperone for outer membrane proteins